MGALLLLRNANIYFLVAFDRSHFNWDDFCLLRKRDELDMIHNILYYIMYKIVINTLIREVKIKFKNTAV